MFVLRVAERFAQTKGAAFGVCVTVFSSPGCLLGLVEALLLRVERVSGYVLNTTRRVDRNHSVWGRTVAVGALRQLKGGAALARSGGD